MASSYAPKQFLRRVDPKLLRAYFEQRGELADFGWDGHEKNLAEAVHAAWRALEDENQAEIERTFREIDEMGTVAGVITLLEFAKRHGVDLAAELDAIDGYVNKAFHVYLQQPEVFNVASVFDHADGLPRRYWWTRTDLPETEPDLSDDGVEHLKNEIALFYLEDQGRGRWCHTDMYDRRDGRFYFFVYLQDFTDEFIGFKTDGKFERRPQTPAFEVVFVLHPSQRQLDLHARGGKRIREKLEAIFGEAILGQELGEANQQARPYNLDGLKDPAFTFATDSVDRIENVRVKSLRMSIPGDSKQRITFETNPKGSNGEIHDLLGLALDRQQLPLAALSVTSAEIQVVFSTAGNGTGRDTKKVTFRISTPDSCNLKDDPFHQKVKGYLKTWGLQND